MSIAIVLALLVLLSAGSFGQACCSAGTPLFGPLEFPLTPSGTWQFSLSYDYNVLRDVISGTQRLVDGSRERLTHSLLFEASYGLQPLLSISVVFSAVQQERLVALGTSSPSLLRTRGIGDAIILFKWDVIPQTLPTQRELTIGVGGKIPLGASTLTSNGILLPADMQPGTGAWDGLAWAYFSQGFLPSEPLTLFVVASHRFTGTNRRYRPDRAGYTFGDETVLSAGAGYRTDDRIDYSVVLRYRVVAADRLGGDDIPNTGGSWLSVLPGIHWWITQGVGTRASILIPLARNLNGTQLTTTYQATISLFAGIE